MKKYFPELDFYYFLDKLLELIPSDNHIIIAEFVTNGRSEFIEYTGQPVKLLKDANIFYTVNPRSRIRYKNGRIMGQGGKKDIEYVIGFFVDLDVGKNKPYSSKAEALEALMKFPLPPTLVIDSGRGIQALWIFEHPLKLGEDITLQEYELMNAEIQRMLNADKTPDVTRLLRAPGTYNTKDPEHPIPTRLLYEHSKPSRRYKLQEFKTLLKESISTISYSKKSNTYIGGKQYLHIERGEGGELYEGIVSPKVNVKENIGEGEEKDMVLVDNFRFTAEEIVRRFELEHEDKEVKQKISALVKVSQKPCFVDRVSDIWTSLDAIECIYRRLKEAWGLVTGDSLYTNDGVELRWKSSDSPQVTRLVLSVLRTERHPSLVFIREKNAPEILAVDFGVDSHRGFKIQEVFFSFLFGVEHFKGGQFEIELDKADLGWTTCALIETLNIWPRSVYEYAAKVRKFEEYVSDKIPSAFLRIMRIILRYVIHRARCGQETMLSVRTIAKLVDGAENSVGQSNANISKAKIARANQALNLLCTYGLIKKIRPKELKTGTTWLLTPNYDFDLDEAKYRFEILDNYLRERKRGYKSFSRTALLKVGLGDLIPEIFKRENDKNEIVIELSDGEIDEENFSQSSIDELFYANDDQTHTVSSSSVETTDKHLTESPERSKNKATTNSANSDHPSKQEFEDERYRSIVITDDTVIFEDLSDVDIILTPT